MRRRCWWLKGKSPYLDVFFDSHGKHYSALCATNIHGFIMKACEVIFREDGVDDSDETRDTVDKISFVQWIEQTFLPVLGKYAFGQPNSTIILENATIHHIGEIINLIESKGPKIIYLPPYPCQVRLV